MSRKIAVLLTEQQIQYLIGYAIRMEDKARDAGRSVSEQFYLDMEKALVSAEQDAAAEREVELNYERGAA